MGHKKRADNLTCVLWTPDCRRCPSGRFYPGLNSAKQERKREKEQRRNIYNNVEKTIQMLTRVKNNDSQLAWGQCESKGSRCILHSLIMYMFLCQLGQLKKILSVDLRLEQISLQSWYTHKQSRSVPQPPLGTMGLSPDCLLNGLIDWLNGIN